MIRKLVRELAYLLIRAATSLSPPSDLQKVPLDISQGSVRGSSAHACAPCNRRYLASKNKRPGGQLVGSQRLKAKGSRSENNERFSSGHRYSRKSITGAPVISTRHALRGTIERPGRFGERCSPDQIEPKSACRPRKICCSQERLDAINAI